MSGSLVAVAVLGLGGAAALAVPAPPRRPRPQGAVLPSRRPSGAAAALVAVLVAGSAAAMGLALTHLALLCIGLAATAGVARLLERSRHQRAATERRQRVVDFCEALVGELQAGQPVVRALERAVPVWSETATVSAAARLGADVPTALRRVAELPGAAEIRRLAGAWELCGTTGAGLAFAVEQVLETARVEQATGRLVQGELASARATARLVTALPVVVLLAAQGIGARPWHFLVATRPGLGCLALGVGLALAGLSWIDRIASAAAEGS